MLIGRRQEIELLKRISQDDNSHFVAVYGRRRIGKTFLIRESFDYRFTFQHAGLSEGGMKEQLFAFVSSMKDVGYFYKRNPKNWLEAFEGLKDLVRQSNERRKIIFIDELSWMDTQKSDLMVAWRIFGMGLHQHVKISFSLYVHQQHHGCSQRGYTTKADCITD